MVETSIIIRAKNEERDIGRVLEAISRQNYVDHEVIVVDSGSTDNTIKIARGHNARIIEIDGRDYRPGRAMNIGAEAGRGKYVLYLSAHAQPLSADWLQNLVRNFKDEKVAACYGKQVPGPDCDPYQELFFYGIFDDDKRVQTEVSLFSAVNGAIRKDLWRELKFNEQLPLREDSIWAGEMIRRGKSIIYEPEAIVVHTHHDNYVKVIKKSYNTYYSLGSADPGFKFTMIKEFKDLLSAYKRSISLLRKGRMSLAWLMKLPLYWFCRTVGFYSGYRKARKEQKVVRHVP